jgi:hypothetical protein
LSEMPVKDSFFYSHFSSVRSLYLCAPNCWDGIFTLRLHFRIQFLLWASSILTNPLFVMVSRMNKSWILHKPVHKKR